MATSSKEEPIKYSEQMDWFFFATSDLFTNLIVNFNLQFDHVSCNLLRAISQSKLQYSQQCCNIPRKRTSGLTVRIYSYSKFKGGAHAARMRTFCLANITFISVCIRYVFFRGFQNARVSLVDEHLPLIMTNREKTMIMTNRAYAKNNGDRLLCSILCYKRVWRSDHACLYHD